MRAAQNKSFTIEQKSIRYCDTDSDQRSLLMCIIVKQNAEIDHTGARTTDLNAARSTVSRKVAGKHDQGERSAR